MIFDWMFDDYRQLAKLRPLAHELANVKWPDLYIQSHLKTIDVPVAAAVFIEDMCMLSLRQS